MKYEIQSYFKRGYDWNDYIFNCSFSDDEYIARSYGGITNYFGESWLYIALFIPCTCAFGYLGYYLSMKNNLLNKQRWKITIVVVLIVSLFGGTIGTIIGETIVRGGMETISIQTTVLSGIFYSFVFLPITLPLGKFIVDILYQWVHQLPWGSMNT